MSSPFDRLRVRYEGVALHVSLLMVSLSNHEGR